jgi:hypothetical protein
VAISQSKQLFSHSTFQQLTHEIQNEHVQTQGGSRNESLYFLEARIDIAIRKEVSLNKNRKHQTTAQIIVN